MTGDLDDHDLIGMHHGPPLLTHPERVCAGQFCSIHKPSAHHMVSWPLIWHDAYQRMERRCPHQLDHPDPDDVAHRHRLYGRHFHPGPHNCDGCCGGGGATITLAARAHVCESCGTATYHHPAATEPTCSGCGRPL